MQYKKTSSHTLREPEVVLNLWAYAGEDGFIVRLAGKAYVLEGEDKTKLSILHTLAATDWLSSNWKKVPANFTLNGPDGKKMKGVAHSSVLADPSSHSYLFGPLMEEIAQDLPEQMRCIEGDYEAFKLELPQEPLTVTTVIMEYQDGRLEPMVSIK